MDFEVSNNNPHAFYRRKTMQVLEKWGVQGEINEVNLRKAASSFARIQKKNTIMKYVTIASIVLLAVFMGMMIASVVIGTEVTKDFKVKEQVLVTKRNGSTSSPVSTSEMFYSSSLNINTPLKVIQGVKRLKFNRKTVDGKDYVFEFDVVSFYYSKGRKISLYGHTHMANILPDSSVEIFPTTTVNGAKRYDTSKRDEYNSTSVEASTTTAPTQVDTRIQISTCDQLQAANNRTGSYLLTTSLSCTLSAPLFPSGFAGTFDGNMNELLISMNRDGPVGLFQSLDPGAVITTLIFNGTLSGNNICGGLAVYASEAVKFDTVTNYANITCARTQDATSPVIVGAFVAISTKSKLTASNTDSLSGGLLFSNCVSQGFIDAQGENPIQGGLYGVSTSDALPVGSTGTSAAAYFINPNYNYTQFGFKSSDFVVENTTAFTRSINKRVTVFPENCTYYWNWNHPNNVEYMANLCSYYYWNASEGNTVYEEPNCCEGFFNSWAYNCPQRECPNNWWVNGCNSYCSTGDQAQAFLWSGTCVEVYDGCKKADQGEGVYHTAVVGGKLIPLFNRMHMAPMVARKPCTTN